MYEIGLCDTWSSPASRIIGPYPNREKALASFREKNEKDGYAPGGSGKGWYWARTGDIRRAEGCVVEAPTD